MADFRRVFTALAVLVLLTGLVSIANAQPTGTAFSCTASAAVPPLLRAEGITELTGDIVLNCSGGVSGTSAGTANFQVFVGNTNVTNRINAAGVADAYLTIDEPGTTLNPTAAICFAVGTGCPAINAYQGVVSGNSVTFLGIPIVPPGTSATGAALTRIYRISNIRVNASVFAGGGSTSITQSQVQAFVSISGQTSVPVNNPTQTIGFVQNGLIFDVLAVAANGSAGSTILPTGLRPFQQCTAQTPGAAPGTPVALLRFSENFATAFKVRGTSSQTSLGAIYNTETGLVLNGVGLADTGTRLKATFANMPTSGFTLYVSTTNLVAPTTGSIVVPPTNAAAPAGAPSAVLVSSETAASTTTPVTAVTGTNYAAVTLTAGAGTAVWEVINANPSVKENFDFGVYIASTPNPGNNAPTAGLQATVTGSFAPTSTVFTASTTAPIPRFVATGTPQNLLIFNVCVTNLLFPYVVNNSQFDTGIAISNTSEDPFGTTPQSGTCTLNFYGLNAPTSTFKSGSIGNKTTDPEGRVFARTTLGIAPGFYGYIIAVCNFQFAHGFAFVSDIGAHNIAMGYLALIMPDLPTTVTARPFVEALNN